MKPVCCLSPWVWPSWCDKITCARQGVRKPVLSCVGVRLGTILTPRRRCSMATSRCADSTSTLIVLLSRTALPNVEGGVNEECNAAYGSP